MIYGGHTRCGFALFSRGSEHPEEPFSSGGSAQRAGPVGVHTSPSIGPALTV